MSHLITSIMDLTNVPTPPQWFEFLLEPERLKRHLEAPNCDPSPIQLITSFLKNIPNQDNPTKVDANSDNPFPTLTPEGEAVDDYMCEIPPDSFEAKYRSKKSFALQILAIKVASFLEWDLDLLRDGLSIPVQGKLMQALTTACSTDRCPPEMKKFASILYCHWFLRSAISFKLSNLQTPSNNTTIIYLSQLQQQQQAADALALIGMGELFSDQQLKKCSDELHSYIRDFMNAKKLKSSAHPFKKAKLARPKMECFDLRNDELNDWHQCEPIEPSEFIQTACYDLGRFYFFEESYVLAKESFEVIKNSGAQFPMLDQYLKSSGDILTPDDKPDLESEEDESGDNCDTLSKEIFIKRKQTEKYLFDCMNQFTEAQKRNVIDTDHEEIKDDEPFHLSTDVRFEQLRSQYRLPPNNAWYQQVPESEQQQQLLEVGKGDLFMSRGDFKQAMGAFLGALMLMTDYFRNFSENYVDEQPYITRMIQCSMSLCCFTQAVALSQMTKSPNYFIAFKNLNERFCNDCCDDIYECLWNVTLLEYVINLHARRGEIERRTRVIQLIGQLELNENNPEEILKEAEHVRRGRFFRIMSNKYL